MSFQEGLEGDSGGIECDGAAFNIISRRSTP